MTQIPGDRTATPEAAAARSGIAICLSGGGYRAALFHLGALRRLNELGLLAGARTISGVSGGAIAASLLTNPDLHWAAEAAQTDGVVDGFEECIAEPLRRLCSRNVRTPALLSKLRPDRWFTDGAAVQALGDELAQTIPWWGRSLSAVPTRPVGLVTGATEVAYGVDWVFIAPNARYPHGRLGDYRMGYAVPPDYVRVADAIAASCAFPPFFAPLVLDGDKLHLTGGTGGHAGPGPDRGEQLRHRIRLTDGGVYDNLALEPVWKDHATVILSDGGAVFRAETERTVWGRLLRILAIATGAGQSVRTRWLYASFARHVMNGTTWGLDVVVPGSYPATVTDLINSIRTDLDAFSVAEQRILERHGYIVADDAVRHHLTQVPVLDVPPKPPHEDVADPHVAARALASSSRRTLLGRF